MVAVVHATQEEAQQSSIVENVTRNLAAWERQPDQCVHLVAEREGRIVGVVLVKDFWNLCSLFVSLDHQRQGIGRRLVQEAIALCRSQAAEPAILLNAAPNAIDFYRALGFKRRRTEKALPPGVTPMSYLHAENDA